jgi:type IV pilus assembly protein PilN
MIRINLLPYRAVRKKENIRFQVNVFIGSIVFAGLLIFWVITMLNGRIDSLNREIRSTNEQVAKYQAINKEIAEIKKALALLDKKIQVIGSLEKDRIAPVQNMDSLYTLLVEKRMWYTTIEEKSNSIKISGIALDNQTVADYMTRIEKSDRFQNVTLASVRHHKMQGKEDVNLKEFDINFQKKPSSDAGEVKQ